MKGSPGRFFVSIGYVFIDLMVVAIASLVSKRSIAGSAMNEGMNVLPLDRGVHIPFDPSSPHLIFTILMTLFLVYFLWTGRFYVAIRETRNSQELQGIARSVFMSVLFAIGIQALFFRSVVAQNFAGAHSLLVFSGLFTWRYFMRKVAEHRISRGCRRTRSLIVGAGKMGRYLEMVLKRKEWLGIDVVGFLDDRYGGDEEDLPDDVVGRISDYEDVARRYEIREIFITIPSERKVVPHLVEISNDLGITVKVVPDMYDRIASEVFVENVGSLPLMKLGVPPLRPFQIYVKRVFEIVVTVPLLILLVPLMALVAVAIKIEDGGSVFFRQKVLGLNGEPITIYKFRSMTQGSDDTGHRKYIEKFVNLNEPADKDKGLYKITDDDRVTRVGRLIRKYSFDEVPQLWNVILGDLSLVGPRPPIPYEYIHYDEYHRKRLLIKPGLTGLWQVSGKSRLSFEKMVMLDILYINDWSFWFDVKIILDTIPVLFRGDNL